MESLTVENSDDTCGMLHMSAIALVFLVLGLIYAQWDATRAWLTYVDADEGNVESDK